MRRFAAAICRVKLPCLKQTIGWLLTLASAANAAAEGLSQHVAAGEDWPYYHGNPGNTHYSQLRDINTGNVSQLQVAWTYDTRDKLGGNSSMESNPLIVDGKLFFISPKGRVISLEGATGRERWTFDPAPDVHSLGFSPKRGVSYWTNGSQKLILYVFGTDLYALDADSGRLAEQFASKGRLALGASASTPGAVYKDLYIIGGAASSIRAFHIPTGKLRWIFHTIPRPGEFGYDTWPPEAWKTAVGVNNWPGMTLDITRGVAFVPLAYPQSYYGGARTGDNLFANSVVALDANTGKRLWHFQAIRHDVWDRDMVAPPTLVTVLRDGKPIEALAQISKHGYVYVLDRQTGKSLFPLVEEPAFPSDVPGEVTAKTQPAPVLPAPFARQHLTAELLTERTPQAAAAVAAQFAKLRSRGLWDPPSEQGTVMLPGMDGGGEWGGAAFDPQKGLLFVNASEMPWILKLKKVKGGGTGARGLYVELCASCHGEDRAGLSPEFPSLLGIGDRLGFHEIVQKIGTGGGRMPAFPDLAADQAKLWPLVYYLQTGVDQTKRQSGRAAARAEAKETYVLDGMPRFVDPDGYPAITPPWGTLNAIDLNTGQYAWKVPLGEYPELAAQGLRNTGSENYGGPIVTAGGVLFIGATLFDRKFRAFNKDNGQLLWETELPAAAIATPATYRVNGRQFVVVTAGGRPPGREAGSKIFAFALPL